MSHHTLLIEGAIAGSISHDEIVTVHVKDIQAGFEALTSDNLAWDWDYVDTRGGYADKPLREVWGTDQEGNEWRVHLQTM